MTNLASSAASSQGRTIAYWVTTVLVAAESVLGGVWDIRQIPYVRADIDKLGYPAYVLVIIGVWKLRCVAARYGRFGARDAVHAPAERSIRP